MERYLRVGEAARRLCVSPQTVRKWFDAGRLEGIRTPSNRRMICELAVDKILLGVKG